MDKKEFDIPSNALVIMVGIQGSGKSTLAKRIAKENTIIVSTDEIHEEKEGKMVGESDEQRNGDEIFKEFCRKIRNGIEEGKQVITDAVSVSRFKRKDLYDIAKQYSVPIRVVIISVKLEQAIEQNKQRDRQVPEKIIRNMDKKLWDRTITKDQYGRTKKYPSEYERIGTEIEELCREGYDAKTCSVYLIPPKEKVLNENER